MKKITTIMLVLATLCVVLLMCINGLFENSHSIEETKPQQSESTHSTEQETWPIIEPTDNTENETTTESREENIVSLFSIKPTHSEYAGDATFAENLPSNDPNDEWWKNHKYGSPAAMLGNINVEDLKDLETNYIKTWDEFMSTKTCDLLTFANTQVATVHKIDEEEADINWSITDLSMINIDKNDNTTVEEAIRGGYWSYKGIQIDKDVNEAIFEIKEIKSADQIVAALGSPSEIYYLEVVEGAFAYFLKYDMGEYSILFGGIEAASETYNDLADSLVEIAGICAYGDGMKDLERKQLAMFTMIE